MRKSRQTHRQTYDHMTPIITTAALTPRPVVCNLVLLCHLGNIYFYIYTEGFKCVNAFHCLADRIYIMGGFNGQESLNSVEYFDPVNNQWTMIRPMRDRRSGVGVASHRGVLYAAGE